GSRRDLALLDQGQEHAVLHAGRGGVAGLEDIPWPETGFSGLTGQRGILHRALGAGAIARFSHAAAERTDTLAAQGLLHLPSRRGVLLEALKVVRRVDRS